ncbi:MBL fold metallo-hydrolase [Legionella bononiensis]|uniref:MBL fold metallo-hydrolase n=1 Tax=Legionella bononiensis TaxID=2793102 RepID=A0ABS1W807_9GAMM|nr:MBL fold metallo-hydrolase [Legionella bononiensis]MBL7480012.1 MBL fold metallo-hydrolase [Legionella bononiensis]MBL7525474.1 MBL fold metallo-hydrolase [Legionella bononiensis]MBL7561657.1 MBL fold metallo-hydrolase [Legionella bononiensis]
MIFHQLFDQDSCTYTYLIGSDFCKHAIIIDPVRTQINTYTNLINKLGLELVASIDTHLHADHITASGDLSDLTGCKSMMGVETQAQFIKYKFSDNELLKFGSLTIKTMHTPGHTPDSYCFLIDDKVFTGDTLLINATGRTDFQFGNAGDQYDSLFNKILKLPDSTIVFPGHDYNNNKSSTIGREKQYNPRLQVQSKDEYIQLMNNLNLPPPKNLQFAVPANLINGISKIPVDSEESNNKK